jgi:hypothetical protein
MADKAGIGNTGFRSHAKAKATLILRIPTRLIEGTIFKLTIFVGAKSHELRLDHLLCAQISPIKAHQTIFH